MAAPTPNDLSRDGCLARQVRLRVQLHARGLHAALLSWRHHVYYFTNHWGVHWHTPLLLVPVEGPVLLVTGSPPDTHAVVDQTEPYVSNHIATMVDNQAGAAIDVMRPHLRPSWRIGCDEAMRPWLLGDLNLVDFNEPILEMRRTKDADELALLRRAIEGADAAYAAGNAMLRPGVTEVDLHAAMHAAAIAATREPIDPFGNDFQSGEPGGPPRDRPVQAGELIIWDLGVQVRAYRCDLSRTFAVDGQPTDQQLDAHRKIVAALDYVERTIKPGVSCRQLYQDVHEELDGYQGWSFPHHLGHGIGIAGHERPRINPHWDDTFQAGDVITCEPGLYGDALNAGIRLEQDYLVTESGVKRLTHFPLGLT